MHYSSAMELCLCLILLNLTLCVSFHTTLRNYVSPVRFRKRTEVFGYRQWFVAHSMKDTNQKRDSDSLSSVFKGNARNGLLSEASSAAEFGSAEDVVRTLEQLSLLPSDSREDEPVDMFSYLKPRIMKEVTPNQAVRLAYLMDVFRSRCNTDARKETCQHLFNIIFAPNQVYPIGMVQRLMCRFAFTKVKLSDLDPTAVRSFYDNLKVHINFSYNRMIASMLFYFELFELQPGTMPMDVQQVFVETIIKQEHYRNVTTGSDVVCRMGQLGFNLSAMTAPQKVAIHDLAERLIRNCAVRKSGGECIQTLKGMHLLGITYDTAAPDLKVTLRKLLSRFGYSTSSMGSFVHRLGDLGLYWELYSLADQRKIESEVIASMKEATPLCVARMVYGMGKILRREKRQSVEVKNALVEAVQRCAKGLIGEKIMMVIEGLIDLRCPLTSLSEEFQLEFNGILESALRQSNEDYLIEVAALLDRWQVDRRHLLPEIQRLLLVRGVGTAAA